MHPAAEVDAGEGGAVIDSTAMFNDLQAYAPYGSPPCHIPHWLFYKYEEWHAASLRFYDSNVG